MDFMSNDPSLRKLVEQFVESIKVELNPNSTQIQRLNARQFCEQVQRETSSSKIATLGIVLTYETDVQIVFAGLRVLEDVTKYNWAELENRDLVKRRLLFLLENGFASLASQPSFLTEALARNVVEIAKREWPQLWPDLVPSLLQSQSFPAFLVLRRLFEDIAFCQNDDPFPRKRELLQSLVAESKSLVPSVFQLLLRGLEAHASAPSQLTLASCKALFGLISPFLELANFEIFEEEKRISLLFQALRLPDVRVEAVECLVQVMNRKGDKKEKPKIVSVFMEDANYMALIEVARHANANEVHIVKQLCDIWTYVGTGCTKDPVFLRKFFGMAEALATRGEVYAVLGAATSVNALLRNIPDIKEILPETEVFEYLKGILNHIVKRLVSPSLREEKEELGRLKSELYMMIKMMSKMWLKLYAFVSPWIIDALNHSDQMEVFQWEALSSVIDSVTATVSHEEDDVLPLGLHHLELCYEKFLNEKNMQRKSAILSSVSGLFIFFSLIKRRNGLNEHMNALMMSIMKSIFLCFSETDRDIRRHAASLLIKLASTNGEIFIDLFDWVHQETMQLKDRLTCMHFTSLIEALLIISNAWEDRTQQLNFIASLLDSSEWQEISSLTATALEFSLVLTESGLTEKRPIFLRNLHIIVAVFNRVTFPTSDALVSATAFADSLFNTLRVVIPIVMGVVKAIHSLLLDERTVSLLEMPASEKQIALGIHDPGLLEDSQKSAEKPLKEKLQVFLRAAEDAAYLILGGCGPKFTNKLYAIPDIAAAYLSYVGSASYCMQHFQIRRILKTVYRPFLLSCPVAHVPTVTIPFLQHFGSFMMNRLVASWEKVKYDETDDVNAPSEEAEIIENSTLRILTKDYFDIILKLLEMSSASSADLNKTFYFGGNADMEEESVTNGHAKSRPYASASDLGEVGKMILGDIACFQSIVHLSATALCWKFSQVSMKASKCILMAMNHIFKFPEVVHAVLTMALRSIVMFADTETNFDNTFRVIDAIFCEYHADATVLHLLREWGVKDEDLLRMKNLNDQHAAANYKKRKEIFRNILKNHPALVQKRGPKSQWLTNLPKLLVHDAEKLARKENASKEIDLKECFSLIHIS